MTVDWHDVTRADVKRAIHEYDRRDALRRYRGCDRRLS
jgi:undecaprenyl pyrophosphate synthase